LTFRLGWNNLSKQTERILSSASFVVTSHQQSIKAQLFKDKTVSQRHVAAYIKLTLKQDLVFFCADQASSLVRQAKTEC